jgi:hypothetical protein
MNSLQIIPGTFYTTSWANNCFHVWRLKSCINGVAYLETKDGNIITTSIGSLREPNIINLKVVKLDNMSKIETTKERVLEAAKKCPDAKNVLESLFPDAFEDNTILCEIGGLFFRRKYPNNIYAVVKHNNKIVAMNITHSTKWDPKFELNTYQLKDKEAKSLTVTEFKKLTGYVNLDEFVFVSKHRNSLIHNYFTNELM